MLTKKQKNILKFIEAYIKKNDYSPTLEEIAKYFRLSSVATVHQHVAALEQKGYLNKTENQRRSINVFGKEKLISVPLLGTIAAGGQIEMFQQSGETIAIPKNKIKPNQNYFTLKVAGESMIEKNINNGDIVLVKEQKTANNGDNVVALIDGTDTTLKTFYKEKNCIRLQPANKNMDPIIIERDREFAVQGIVTDIIKNLGDKSASTYSTKKIEKYRVLPVNQIICGDAVEELKKIPDNSVDLVITDPPYGISRELNCKNKRLGSTAKLNFNFGEWDKFSSEWLDLAIKKTNGWFISFCAKKDIATFWAALENNGFIAIDALVWQKPDPVPLNAKSRFLNAWEMAVMGKRPGATWNSTYEHNILKYQAPKNKNRIHPTQKPLELIKKLILLTTKKDGLVLDPFMGSGTTAAACKESNRNYIGFEISEEYCGLAKNRINNISAPLITD